MQKTSRLVSCLCAGSVALLSLAQALNAAAATPAATRATQEAALVAALPHDMAGAMPNLQAMTEGEIAHVAAVNPGKDKIVREIVARKATCRVKATSAQAQVIRVQAVHTLSDDTLKRLTTLFTGPDYKRVVQIQNEDKPTKAEQAEATAIVARYQKPMDELQTAFGKSTTAGNGSSYLNALQACDNEQAAAFKKARIKTD